VDVHQNTHPKFTYQKNHCYQFEIRQTNLESDLKEANLSLDVTENLKVSDFEFRFIPKDDQITCKQIKAFIEKHEWLGKMPHRPTHRFIATYKGVLAGVIVMATPNAFSNLLGAKNRDKEKLISRGACISWSPKNLASSLIMFSICWMVKHTEYRFFSAYSDTEARELGTIYQACNFIYLGQNSGARYEYLDPKRADKGWFSDRNFRKTTSFKKYAEGLNIFWQKDWSYRDKIFWDKIPDHVQKRLKAAAKEHQKNCQRRPVPRKHKYVYIQGKSKKETKRLHQTFRDLNPKLVDLPYPKSRGPNFCGRSKDRILEQQLTGRPDSWWPSKEVSKKFYTIKEVSSMYGIGQWLLYSHIKSDPSFPHINVGLKKRYMIELHEFDSWLRSRNKSRISVGHDLPEANDLMEVGR
tara:strand:+ start:2176 stop:3405 length:1230 start_codon:yes stop_codon:yes gene_type:complete